MKEPIFSKSLCSRVGFRRGLLGLALVASSMLPFLVAHARAATPDPADTDPGCRGLTATILSLLPPRPQQGAIADYLRTPYGQMLDAALRGDLKMVEAQLDSGVSILVQDWRPQYKGSNALHHAARTNNVELAQLLLSRGMDVNAPGPTGFSALHVASGLGNLKMVRFLLDHGANISQVDQRAGTPLEIAVVQGRARTVELLISRGALAAPPAGHDDPMKAIGWAESLCPSHVQVVLVLKRAGVRLDSRNDSLPSVVGLAQRDSGIARMISEPEFGFDWTSPKAYQGAALTEPKSAIVHLACASESAGVALDLFKKSPDRETLKKVAVGPWGTPLHCVQDSWDQRVLKGLLQVGFDPNAKDRNDRTALHRDIDAATVKVLVSAGADVNARDNEGKTPLFYTHYPDVIQAYLELGANPNIADRQGRTPLFEAIGPSSMRALIAKRANVEARDEGGRTPLIYRVEHGNDTDGLTEAGADVNARDNVGATAMHYGLSKGNERSLALLNPANLAVLDKKGRTPLHYLAMSRDRYFAEGLAFAQKNGADLNARDSEGNTPLHYAVLGGRPDIATALLKAGANAAMKNNQGLKPADLVPPDGSVSKFSKVFEAQ